MKIVFSKFFILTNELCFTEGSFCVQELSQINETQQTCGSSGNLRFFVKISSVCFLFAWYKRQNLYFSQTTRRNEIVAMRNVLFDHPLHFEHKTQIAKFQLLISKDSAQLRIFLKVLLSVPMCLLSRNVELQFFRSLLGMQSNRCCVAKSLGRASSTDCRKLRSEKLHSPKSFVPKSQFTFQSHLFAFKTWIKSLKQKTEQDERSKHLYFGLTPFSMKLIRKKKK